MTREDLTHYELDDHELMHLIVEAISQDRRVPIEKIGVRIEGGDIILTGIVDCIGQKNAAEEDARRIPGVNQVWNYIGVRPERSVDDMEIVRNIMEALAGDARVREGNFDVVSNNKVVHLRGEAVDQIEKRAALDDANLVYGVEQVIDEVIILPERTSSDHLLEEQVMQELSRAPFLDERQIFVYVKEGVAFLSGTVDFPQQLEIARQTALDVPGVQGVVSELTVQQSA